MKVIGIEGLLSTIYIGVNITLYNKTLSGDKDDPFIMEIFYDQVLSKIGVDRGCENGEVEYYNSFRNGDKNLPDLERFCEGYAKALNHTDTEIEIY